MMDAYQERLPNFFILGAAKAGTTSLYELLQQHPDIHLSFDKEPMYFSRDDYFSRGADWYANTYFPDSASFARRGEATPHYLYWAEKVAPRIRATYADAPPKFIAILRHPVQRAHSWYWNMVLEGQESLSFPDALRAEDERLREHRAELESKGSMRYGYARGGRYLSQLRTYMNVFPAERMHVLLLEDLQQDQAAALVKICSFLGVRTDFKFKTVSSNRAAAPRSRNLQQAIRRPSAGRDLLKQLIPFRVRHRAKTALLRMNRKDFDPPDIEEEAHRYLHACFSSELADLAGLIQRDLSHWIDR